MSAVRRHCLKTLALLALAPAAWANDPYPSKPVTIVVAYAPGGQGDVFARLVGERLSGSLKQSFVVDNKPGVSGTVGTRIAARARPDGYTLFLGQTGEMVVNQSGADRLRRGAGLVDVEVSIMDGAMMWLKDFIRVTVNGQATDARIRALAGGKTV